MEDIFIFCCRKWISEDSELLIDKGANINTKDFYDRPILFYAIKKGNLEIVQILIDKGADINVICHWTEIGWYFHNNDQYRSDDTYNYSPLLLALRTKQANNSTTLNK